MIPKSPDPFPMTPARSKTCNDNDWGRPRNRNYYHSLTYIFALRACACPQGGV